jgi:hypothetical protein
MAVDHSPPSTRKRLTMPFKSQAQRRKFAQLLVEGKISPETFEEWSRETGSRRLPERAGEAGPRRRRTTGRRKTAARKTAARKTGGRKKPGRKTAARRKKRYFPRSARTPRRRSSCSRSVRTER